jgi:hypothetical protein
LDHQSGARHPPLFQYLEQTLALTGSLCSFLEKAAQKLFFSGVAVFHADGLWAIAVITRHQNVSEFFLGDLAGGLLRGNRAAQIAFSA